MVKKTFFKTIQITFKHNISRFFVICLVVLLGIAFISGLGTLSSSLTDSIQDYYQEQNGLDLILKSKSETGFTLDEINEIQKMDIITEIKQVMSIDQDHTRYIFSDWTQNSFHQWQIVEGKAIENDHEILVDQISNKNIGETVQFLEEEFTIVGIVQNPSYYTLEKELSVEEKELDTIYYFDSNYYNHPFQYVITDLYIQLDKKIISDPIFSKKYEDQVKPIAQSLEEQYNLVALTLDENLSYALVKSYGKKINLLAAFFPLFFLIVSCLVVYSTISRLIEEERDIIGCYRSLGIFKSAIILKYFLFTFITCLLGSIAGFSIGIHLLPTVIYPAFEAMFFMPEMTSYRFVLPGIFTAVLMVLLLCIITIFTIFSHLKEAPCNLLRPKSPKAGKKILLEKIPFLWKQLSFKYKSSFRNIFRYKVNLFMTLVSVAGSTALTFAGFGLFAIALSPDTTKIPISMADSFALISLVIIAFAAILCVLVVFNITNMNIQERTREIATLRVLGYQKKEVGLYIYREINITSLLSVLLGIPLGYVFLNFIFQFLEFGDIKNVNWYYYLFTVCLVLLFVLLAEALLRKKIHKVDMNGSLKSNE